MASDAGLTMKEELQKDMLECLDRFKVELQTRSKSLQDVVSLFEIVQTDALLLATTEKLKLATSKFTDFYDEVLETELFLEIPRLRRHLKIANVMVTDWVFLDSLEFIVEWDFTESLPDLMIALKLFMTVCVSVVLHAPTCKYDKIIIVGASRGESVDIVCEIESDPPAKSYRWKFNNSGETLDVAAERFAKTSNGSFSILRYTPVSELDYGSLSCWASNSVGHQIDPCVFQLVAAGKPFPVKNCTLTNQTSSSVEVFCLPGFDGGLPQHFLLELYSTNSAIPRFNMTSFTEPYFFLDNLEPDVTFRIVVFSVNSKGRSHGVILEEVTFRDAEKRTG
nr:nephrin-like [Leptinotarsa decemlineata]